MQTPFYFPFNFLDNTSHKFWDQSPSPHYQCFLQVSETVSWHKLRCCYSTNILQHWVGGRGLIYFCKVDYSRISRNFSRNWVGLNNLCEILQIRVKTVNTRHPEMKLIACFISFRSFWQKWNLISVDKCYVNPEMKSYERKLLRMRIFHKNKDSRTKDQNKNEFHFILPAMKTNWHKMFLRWNEILPRFHVSTI